MKSHLPNLNQCANSQVNAFLRRPQKLGLGLAAVIATLLLPQSGMTESTLPFYEPFGTNYLEGEQLGAAGSSGLIWDFGNSVSSSCGRIRTVAGLVFPGVTNLPDSRGLVGGPTGGTSSKSRGASFTSQTNVTLYASFFLNLQAVTNRVIAALSSDTSTAGTSVGNLGVGVFVDVSGSLRVSKNSTTTPTSGLTYALATNTTHLVVIRYKYNSGGNANDEAALWLDPTSLGSNGDIPAPTITTTNGNDVTALRSFGFMGPVPIFLFYMDEVRVGTNWADVTPTTPSPGTVFNVTGGGSVCAGTGFPVGLSGSQAGVDYWLFTNGVTTTAVIPGTGSALNFGSQADTAIYTVLASNTTSTAVGWMKGNANIALLAAPGLSVPPAAVTAVSGSAATFSVAATGDGLIYQWRRNGTNLVNGGNISGATSPNLTVAPVGAADAVPAANGYDVVVSGSCSPPATSTKVALTLKPQSSLVWSGDGVFNLWDVATTQSWLAGGAPAAFNFGDKVTFDDTSANTTVTLSNSFLSPATITVTGANNYTFTGGGRISGSATSLIMQGSGTLTMNFSNSFGGGTTISSGMVSLNSGAALGVGPITLSGGILDVLNAQVTLPNAINVTTDSTINVHNTSTSALQLDGPLSGTGGALTIANSTAASPTVRLAATNFTFNRPLVLNIATGTGLLLASYNTNGDQTFNGEISGGGRLERRTTDANIGSGNTILNAQNTYFGGTLLRDGGLGLGVSSISTAPPTLDSGPLGTGPLTNDTAQAYGMRLFAVGGPRTVGNAITWLNTNAGPALVFTGTNDLTLSGAIDLAGNNRILQVDNTGRTILTGDISNGSLTKTGNGALYINGNVLVTDPLVISAGTLGGTGVISSPVTIAAGATLSPGNSIGALTINGDLTLQGNVLIEVAKFLSPSSDFVTVSGALNNTGTGTVTVGSILDIGVAVGDKFTLFSKPVANGNALKVVGSGVTWANNLAVDGSVSVVSVGATKPVITSTVISGNSFIFSGTNGTGTAGGSYYVLSSTDVALPLANWTREVTNPFLAGGTFSATNPIVPGVPIKFYLLQLP